MHVRARGCVYEQMCYGTGTAETVAEGPLCNASRDRVGELAFIQNGGSRFGCWDRSLKPPSSREHEPGSLLGARAYFCPLCRSRACRLSVSFASLATRSASSSSMDLKVID